MPDSSGQGQGQRRANWVALRRFRHLPKAAGRTDAGDPIFEIKSVRLVLRRDAGHFNRLVRCSKCGRDVVGSPVLTPDDLEREPSPVICQACVHGAAGSASWRPEALRAASPAGAASPSGTGEQEVEVRAPAARLAEVAQAVDRQPAPDTATKAGVQAAVDEAVAQARAELAAANAATEGRVAAVDEQVRQALAGLTELLATQRAEVAKLAQAMGDARTELERLGEVSGSLHRSHEELGRSLQDLQAEMGRREQRVEQGMARLSEMLRAQLGPVLHAQDELAQAHAGAEHRLKVIASSVAAGESRLHVLEQRMQEILRRIVDGPGESRRGPAVAGGEVGTSLVDALDAQLRAAETRLAARATTPEVHSLIEATDEGR